MRRRVKGYLHIIGAKYLESEGANEGVLISEILK